MMKKMRIWTFLLFFSCLFCLIIPAYGQSADLETGIVRKFYPCGDRFDFVLSTTPVIANSMDTIVADDDMRYIIFRVDITNKSESIWNGFDAESFILREIYEGKYYQSYKLNGVLSGRKAPSYRIDSFFDPIIPGDDLYTILIFEVFPDVDGWDFFFSPRERGPDTAVCEVAFHLPKCTDADSLPEEVN